MFSRWSKSATGVSGWVTKKEKKDLGRREGKKSRSELDVTGGEG